MTLQRIILAAAAAAATLPALTGCEVLAVGAIAGTAAVTGDRRSTGTQLDDQTNEIKALSRARELTGETAHINTTSYNRIVLLTGEVPNEADRVRVEEEVRKIDGVRSVVNELAVLPNSALSTRSNDSLITGRVKTSFVEAKDLRAGAIKVVTERGIVYLMGIVSEGEAARAAERARLVGGVQKVVRVFEIVPASEVGDLNPPPPSAAPKQP